MAKAWLLAVASIGMGVALMECVVRVYYASTGHPPPHPDPSVRQEWEWASEHLAAGSPMLPGSATFDLRFGWVPDQDAGAWLARASAGMTRPAPADQRRTPGVPRLVLMGDSFTFGVHVDTSDNYPNVLQRDHLPGWEVLNFGVPGYGPDQMALMYEEVAAGYQPDIAVLALYTEGAYRAARSFDYYAKPYYEYAAGETLILRGVPVIPPEFLYDDYRSGIRTVAPFPYSYLYGAVATSLARLRDPAQFEATNAKGQLIEAILTRFHEQAAAQGTRPFVLVIPDERDLQHPSGNGIDALVQSKAVALKLPCLSLLEGFRTQDRQHPESPLYRDRDDGGHFSVRGHQVAAELLSASLRDAGLTL